MKFIFISELDFQKILDKNSFHTKKDGSFVYVIEHSKLKESLERYSK